MFHDRAIELRALDFAIKIRGMKALKIVVNGEEKCVAGIGEFGNLHAVISYLSPHPDDLKMQPPPPETMPAEMINVAVSGVVGSMSGPQIHSLSWLYQNLEVGDRVEFTVVEVDKASAPDFDEKREIISKQSEI